MDTYTTKLRTQNLRLIVAACIAGLWLGGCGGAQPDFPYETEDEDDENPGNDNEEPAHFLSLSLNIVTPPDGASFLAGHPVELVAEAEELGGGQPAVLWSSDVDGQLGAGLALELDDLSHGDHLVTARAIGSMGTAEDQVSITIYNDEPEVAILEPASGASFVAGESIVFRGESNDLNYYPDFTLPDEDVVWESDVDGILGYGHEIEASLSLPPSGSFHLITFRGVDDTGAAAEATVVLVLEAPQPDLPPTVAITSPDSDVPIGELIWQYDGYDRGAEMHYKDVLLEGIAVDPEDGALSGSSLRWSTDRTDLQDGRLDSGNAITARLYGVGRSSEHVVTLTATDSAGHSRSVTRVIRIWAVM